MQLAFWNNGAPQLVNARRVELPNGDTVMNARVDPTVDLYEYIDVGGHAGILQIETLPTYANDGWTITATRVVTYKSIEDIRVTRLAEVREETKSRLQLTDWEVLAAIDPARGGAPRNMPQTTKDLRTAILQAVDDYEISINIETDPATAIALQPAWLVL